MELLEFRRWNDFRAYVDNDRQALPVYWRGQRNPSWPLASLFERSILDMFGGWKDSASKIFPYDDRYLPRGEPLWGEDFYTKVRDGYLNAFKRGASGLRGSNPERLEPDQWWALGRNYALITPLLDWTKSPYIAAFFPLVELYADMVKKMGGGGLSFAGDEVAVYRLFHNEQLEGDGLRVVTPLVEELGRMQSQRSLFTWLDSEKYFELQGFLDDTGRGDLLTQIKISDQALLDGLRDLRAHGIDHRLLFPDLAGAAQYANNVSNFF